MEVCFKDVFTVILIKWPKNIYTCIKTSSQFFRRDFLEDFFFTLPSSQRSKYNVLECGHIECIYRNMYLSLTYWLKGIWTRF